MGKNMHGGCTVRVDDPRRFHSFGRSGENALFGDSCGRSRRGKRCMAAAQCVWMIRGDFTPSEGVGETCCSVTPAEGVGWAKICMAAAQCVWRIRGDFTPSEGVGKMRCSATPAEGVRGAKRCKAAVQYVWRIRGDFTPSKGVGKMRCSVTPAEGVGRIGRRHRGLTGGGGRKAAGLWSPRDSGRPPAPVARPCAPATMRSRPDSGH